MEELTLPKNLKNIGEAAFRECSKLESITIPEGVETIDRQTFGYCHKLTTVVLPNNLKTIGEGAFSDCNALNDINIPDGVTTIGSYAFSGCSVINEFNIPNGVTSIGDYAFSYCTGLKSPVILPDNITEISEGLFSYDDFESVTIQNHIKTIGNGAFRNCEKLESVTIPECVTSIGDYAFAECKRLPDIDIPSSVTEIGGYAFAGCAIKDIAWPENINVIKEGTFSKCSKLESIEFPNDLTELGRNTFSYCTSLTKINIPEGVTYLGDCAFLGCTYLTDINIPESVTYLGDGVFQSCPITKIFIPEGVTYLGSKAFLGTALTDIELPEGITEIKYSTFEDCSYLKSISIPRSITRIGSETFKNCESLTDVYYSGTEEQWNRINISDNNEYLKNAEIHFIEPCETHTWDSGIVTKEPTYDAEGEKTYTCTVCGETKTEAISKLTPIITKQSIEKAAVSGISDKNYTGKALTQSITVKLGKTALKNGTDYAVSYKNNINAGTATVTITGKATITITAANTTNYKAAVKKVTITVNPKGTAISNVTNIKGKKMTVKWKKNAAVTGYQIQYSSNVKFSKAKTVTVTSAKVTGKTFANLTKNKTYYVRIRTYKKVGKVKYYSAWSGSKKVTIKK